MINKANMRAWVAALRSGNYQQCKHMLTSVGEKGEDRYCCLGVACAVSGVAERGDSDDGAVTWDRCEVELPRRVMDWLGVKLPDPDVDLDLPATPANDARGQTFAQIADAIEKYYDLAQQT